MIGQDKTASAKKVYDTLCAAIESNNWRYEKDEENWAIIFTVSGEDLPLQFIIFIDTDRQLIRLLSPLSFKMSEDKRIEGAIATCAVTYALADGSFDYDISDGTIAFRMTASFLDSVIGEELLRYMIFCACITVDKYNDKFLALNKGLIGIDEFIDENC